MFAGMINEKYSTFVIKISRHFKESYIFDLEM